MSETKVLPCPFCGGEAKIRGYYFVQCTKCGVSTLSSINIEGAIEAWNTRKPVERILERLEEEKKKPDLYVYAVDAYYKAIEIIKEEVQHD